MAWTALLSASHFERSSQGLPLLQKLRQRARCCVRLFGPKLSVKLYMHCCTVMTVMADRMTRTASLSASHSSPGLPPR